MAIRIDRLSLHIGIAILILLLVGLLAPSRVSAQQTIIPLQLSFSDPGARSMGFGGAFVALADDATAAFANPAGLTQLLKPEFSIEARSWSHSTPYTEGGRAEGLPSGSGLDSTVGLRTAISEYDDTGLSFLSLAYPLGKWSFAFFRHEYANLEFSSETQGLYGGGTNCCQQRMWDLRSTSDLEMVSYGVSAGYRIGDRLNVGLGLVHYDASIEAMSSEYLWDDDTVAAFLAPNSYLYERWLQSERLFVDDTDWGLSAGVLWRLTERFSIGGVYRQGPEVEMGGETIAGAAVDIGVPPGTVIFSGTGQPVDFPDIWGLGFAYRGADGRFTLSVQWDRVEYSDIPSSLALDDQTIDDADELHLGAEYVFVGQQVITAVRLGTWFEPDHQMYATDDDPFFRAIMPRGEDEMHYAIGLGIAMQRFQIDFAADFADRADTVSLSAIYSF
jgi:long-subunit fatty acid transport protein